MAVDCLVWFSITVLFATLAETTAWTGPSHLNLHLARIGTHGRAYPSPLLPSSSSANVGALQLRTGAFSLAMAGSGKKKKGPRKRSQRLNNQDEFRNAGPVGAAKRKILEKQEQAKVVKSEEWDGLRDRLIAERASGSDYPVGWAGDLEELKRKRLEWNADMFAPSSDEQTDENNIQPTNDPAWMQVTDPASGDVYFWNIESDATVWDVPEGVAPDEELSDFRGITKTIADPSGAEGSKWLCTQTTSGHCHHGIFFQIDAKEQDIYITGIRTAAHYRSDIYEGRYRVLVRDSEVYGSEMSKDGWRQVGFKQVRAEVKTVGPKSWDALGLPRTIKTSAGVMFDMLPGISAVDTDPEVIYGSLPLSEAIHVPKGGKKAICIWNDDMLGIVLRKKDNFVNHGRFKANRFMGGFFDKGEITDENADLRIRCGLVPRRDVFRGVLNSEGYCAFVGVLQYVMAKGNVPDMPEMQPDDTFELDTEGEGEDAKGDFVVAVVTTAETREAMEAEGRVPEMQSGGIVDLDDDDEEETEAEQEEVDAEDLMQGPSENFFGGEGEPTAGMDREAGVVTLYCFMGDKELGELGVDAGTTWDELRGALQDFAGAPIVMSFRHPDGVGEVAVSSEQEWAAALDILLDDQWDLDGFIDVDVKLKK